MISENFYDGDEISQSNINSQDNVSQGDEVSDNNQVNSVAKSPESEFADSVDHISQKIQKTAEDVYSKLPEPKSKSTCRL